MSLKRRNASYIPTPPRSRGVSRRSSSSAIATQIAARAAVTALNAIAPGVGTAARYAGQAYRLYSGSRRKSATSKGTTTTSTRSSGHWGGVSNATYGGKFKKPTKKLDSDTKIQAQYQAQGYVGVFETRGKVDDADCVYVGNSTMQITAICGAIVWALMRKLFKKAGMTISGKDEVLPLNGGVNAKEFRIQLTWIAADGTLSSTSFDTTANTTLDTIMFGTWSNGQPRVLFQDVARGLAQIEFDQLFLSALDFNVTSTERFVAGLNLKEEIPEVLVKTEMTVQNRTKSDSGSVDAESVDNQPLKGKLYVFKGVPRFKQSRLYNLGAGVVIAPNALTGFATDGIILEQSKDIYTQSSVGNPFREPPNPAIFQNCIKSSNVSLEPGTIKTFTLSHKYSGYLNNLLARTLNIRNMQVPVNPTYINVNGKTAFLALEERLNTGSLNLITVNYELQQMVMCKSKTVKKPTFLVEYAGLAVRDNTG